MSASTMNNNEPEEESRAENLATLAEYRSKNVRASEEIVQRGERVLRIKGALKRMGDEGESSGPLNAAIV